MNSNIKDNKAINHKAINNQVSASSQQGVGILTINYPPVNALSQIVRQGIIEGLEYFESDANVFAVVITCESKTFIAGADIKEFGLPPTEPFLPQVVNRIEACHKPVIAAMFGTSLGGGFEVALACHYRVALASAKVGLPEVNLGLIPGAGGTQRLPRIVGVEKALEMITSGKHYSVTGFEKTALFDAIFKSEDNLLEQTVNFAIQQKKEKDIPVKRVGEAKVNAQGIQWDEHLKKIKQKARGKVAPVTAVEVLHKTCDMSLQDGMAFERQAFLTLRESEQSAALRFAFAAEKKAAKTDFNAQPLTIKKVGIIGAGNMGSGIATAFLTAGYAVCLIEQTDDALKVGVGRVESNFNSNVKRGGMSRQMADDCLQNLSHSTNYQSLSDCDLVIEAVFEDIEVKKALFSKIDGICQSSCIFATNTSYLDINEIAAVVKEPSRVVGMHFFSPANIMKLLEVVKAEKSSEQALVTAMEVAKKLRKVSVLVGVCFGFAGNRMYTRYGREIQQMLLEGAAIEQVDRAMTNWGMAMGPLAVQDLSGIDIGHNARSAQPFPEHDKGYFRAAAVLVENGRLGRKTEKGFYQYVDGKAHKDEIAEKLITEKAKSLGFELRPFSDDEIVERALFALISEGLALMQEGIVQRLSDIDVIWLHGYGFPRHKGGPMYQAQQIGADKVAEKLSEMRQQFGKKIWPEVDVESLNA